MFARIVSLVLVAAVIACPMWCSYGLCSTGQPCASHEPLSQKQTFDTTSPAQCKCECCEEATLPTNDEQCPHRCPEESSCQGICGGAVFEKTCELEDLEVTFLLPQTDSDGLNASALAHSLVVRSEQQHHLGAKNYGRIMRTLRSSFLC